MKIDRSSGILLHPSSLPGPYGIGDFGLQAYRWVDFLADSGSTYWQVLPLGPTGFGDSPYQSFSSFAGNPLFISPDLLLDEGLLVDADLKDKPDFPHDKVDFALVNQWKSELLAKAYRKLVEGNVLTKEYNAFREGQASWLEDFALYMALKKEYAGVAWMDWPVSLRDREQKAIREARQTLEESIAIYVFGQFLFFRQWEKLRAYMAERDIMLIGDLPIYAAQDSADVWIKRDLFQLESNGMPSAISGVPPDYFSETGQLWGNPLYRWEKHTEEGFSWWHARIKASLNLVDILRLDHFRGFADYWSVQANEKTAVNGRWQLGPGESFFHALKKELGDLPIIAEDLGEISPIVYELRDQFSLPGMKILQFAFDDGMEHEFLPHNYPENCVAYTGTHDNDTTQGWFKSAPKNERDFSKDYLKTDGSNIARDFVQAVWGSLAKLAIAPIQDFLELDSEARMNYPSSAQGNWAWRMGEAALSKELSTRIADLNEDSGRVNPSRK
jgi:4-alpha-glucanotransferase